MIKKVLLSLVCLFAILGFVGFATMPEPEPAEPPSSPVVQWFIETQVYQQTDDDHKLLVKGKITHDCTDEGSARLIASCGVAICTGTFPNYTWDIDFYDDHSQTVNSGASANFECEASNSNVDFSEVHGIRICCDTCTEAAMAYEHPDDGDCEAGSLADDDFENFGDGVPLYGDYPAFGNLYVTGEPGADPEDYLVDVDYRWEERGCASTKDDKLQVLYQVYNFDTDLWESWETGATINLMAGCEGADVKQLKQKFTLAAAFDDPDYKSGGQLFIRAVLQVGDSSGWDTCQDNSGNNLMTDCTGDDDEVDIGCWVDDPF